MNFFGIFINLGFNAKSLLHPVKHAGYAARFFLHDFLAGKGLDTKAMLREEREYLDRHREIKAGPYLRGKELFLEGFRNVTEEEFYCFCRLTRPFSGFAAFWCLEEAFAHCRHDPERFLALIASHEEAYLQERGNTISMARWEDSRERFRFPAGFSGFPGVSGRPLGRCGRAGELFLRLYPRLCRASGIYHGRRHSP